MTIKQTLEILIEIRNDLRALRIRSDEKKAYVEAKEAERTKKKKAAELEAFLNPMTEENGSWVL